MVDALHEISVPDATTAYATPLKYTDEEVEDFLKNYYTPLPNLWSDTSNDWRSLQKGQDVLWFALKRGKANGISTTKEYFHGVFHGWAEEAKEWRAVVN